MQKMRKGEGRRIMWCSVLLSEVTVEPVLFLYMLAIFSQYALFQDLVYTKVCNARFGEIVCENLNAPGHSAMQAEVQTTSSHWILMSTITLVIPSLLIAIYLGSWSDRFGRKWPVVIPPFGGALGCIVFIVISFKKDAPVDWILLASAISGLSGGFVSCIMSCMSYVASVSSSENRTTRLSRLEAMTFLGGTIGPFISGSMLGVTGHGLAFCFMAASYAVACLYAIFFVKDVHDSYEEHDDSESPVPQMSSSAPDYKEALKEEKSARPLLDKSSKSQNDIGIDQGLGSSGSNLNMSQHENDNDNDNDNGDLDAETETETESTSTGIVTDNEFDENEPQRPISIVRAKDAGKRKRSALTSISTQDENMTTDDDESRNIILRQSRFQTPKIESCCTRYFNPKHLLEAMSTVFKRREGNRRVMIILVILAAGVSMVNTAGELDVAYLFAKDQPLNWSYQIYSYYFGFKYGLGVFMLLVGMPIFQKWNLDDSFICILGVVSRMAGLILYGFSVNTWMAFCAPILGMFSFFTLPAMRALLSKLVAPSEQGKMFSFVAIMEDLCTLTASVVFNSVYPITRDFYRGFIFFMAAALLLIPLVVIGCARRKLSQLTPSPSYTAALPGPEHGHGRGSESGPDTESETDVERAEKSAAPTTALSSDSLMKAMEAGKVTHS